MKTRNKFCALAAAVSLLAGMLPMGAAASGGASMSIDTDTVIKNQSAQMYGISTDYAVNLPYLSYNEETDKIEQSIQFKTAMNEYGFPLVRIGEGASDTFKWKQAIGPWADRTEQTMWNTTGKVAGGTAEYAELFRTIDAGAQFTVTLNMETDTAQDAADLAQFLTGGADTEWGKKRIDYGFEKPFNVKAYELGNELDWSGVGGSDYTVAQYIADCKTYIAAVRAVSPDAKFIAFADTANYNKQKNGEDWRAWHKAILADAELAGEIDYIALHTYFDLVNNGLMDTIISAIEEDIAASAGKDRIKVYLSEYAVSNFTTPHSMDSILETANILSRTMWHDGIEMATYHGISSAAWQNIIYNSSTGEMRLNGIGNMLKMFKNYGVGDVLSANFTGFAKNTNSTASGVAVKASDGKIKVIMTNDSASELPVKLNFSDSAEYQLNDEMIITASEPEKSGKDVKTQKYTYASPSVVTQYTMPAYSVCAITLEKRKNVTKTTLYSNDFSNDETYTVYGTDSDSAQVADGKLSFTGSALGANYVYLPYKNENASFRFEADITVDEILDEENENGIVINSSKNDGEFNDGNLIKIKGGTVTEVTYENGNQGETLGEGTTDPLENEKTIHIVYDKTAEGSVSFSINGAEVYSRSGGVKNSAGYIGFLFADSYSVDNVEISNYSAEEIEKTEIKKTFTYEENFDGLADGAMPEGWEVMSGELTAGVQDGAFVVDAINSEWDKTYDVIQFTNLGNVQRDGLVMEADFTMLSYNTSAKGYGQRPFAGFAHTVDGEKMGSIGHLSFYPQSEAREYGSSSTPTGSTVDLGGEAYAAGTKTLHLKAVYGAKGSPDLYIDGTKVSYYNISDTSVNMGKIGLAGYLTKFKIDNLKITGIKSEVYSASDVTEITVPFDYEENFDNIAEGSLPASWYVGDINGDTPTISASVSGGKLVMKNSEWWHGDYMVFGNLGEVYNNGVTVEFDVTATTKTVASDQNVTNNAGVGPAYAIGETDGKAEGYSVKFFTAVNPTTHKIQAQKQESKVTDYNIALAEGETNVMSGATKRVKIVMVNNTETPDIYIDGVKVNAGKYGWRGPTAYTSETGKVGIFLRSAGVEIDNVHVSGKRKIKVSGTSTIDAAFKSAGGVYDTEEDAIADVRVMQKFTSGDELDVTSMANITSSVSGFDGVITVTYDGKEIKKLPYKLNVKEESFIYEENFDNIADGSLPAGWYVGDENGDKPTLSASVNGGKLVMKNSEWWHGDYMVFGNLGEVYNNGVTVEFDVTATTKTVSSNQNVTNNAGVGPAYAIGETDGKAEGYSVKFFTAVGETAHKIQAQKQESKVTDYNIALAEGETNVMSGETKRVKIVMVNNTQTPDIYIDGVKVNAGKYGWRGDTTYTSETGKVGIFLRSAGVEIDNVRVSGKRLVPVSQTGENKITVTSAALSGDKLNIAVNAQNYGADTSAKLFAAVYGADGKLVGVSGLKDWNTAIFDTALTVDGMSGYTPETHTIKVMAWDFGTLKPISGSAVK